MKKMANYWN